MKGTVVSFFEKKRQKDQSIYLTVLMNVDGTEAQYFCSDAKTMEMVRDKVGAEIEVETFKTNDGSATFITLPKTNAFKPFTKKAEVNRDPSFAASYSKDIVIACINNSIIQDTGDGEASKVIDGALTHFYHYFLSLMNQKDPAE